MAKARRPMDVVLLSVCLLCLGPLHTRADPPGNICPPAGGSTGQPSCVCQHPDGIIDLTALASKSGPRWSKVPEKDSSGATVFNFDYNPCSTFTTVDPCSNVYICQETPDGTGSYKIADAGTEQIYIDSTEGTYVYYTSPTDDGNTRESIVTLVCDQGLGAGKEQLATTGDSQVTLLYRFTLKSCHACPGGCTGGGGSIAGYIGIILILILILALVLYFVIGAVILKVRFQKTGSDIVPNKSFWVALPFLIKDGFKFTISPCMKAVKKDYEPL